MKNAGRGNIIIPAFFQPLTYFQMRDVFSSSQLTWNVTCVSRLPPPWETHHSLIPLHISPLIFLHGPMGVALFSLLPVSWGRRVASHPRTFTDLWGSVPPETHPVRQVKGSIWAVGTTPLSASERRAELPHPQTFKYFKINQEYFYIKWTPWHSAGEWEVNWMCHRFSWDSGHNLIIHLLF